MKHPYKVGDRVWYWRPGSPMEARRTGKKFAAVVVTVFKREPGDEWRVDIRLPGAKCEHCQVGPKTLKYVMVDFIEPMGVLDVMAAEQ
jgi:hypothetical protein